MTARSKHCWTGPPAPRRKRVEEIIAKALELKGLTPEETAVLLQTEDEELIERIWAAAREIKQAIYGNRLVLFAPLYIANHCSNDCLYCGFRRSNKELTRVALTMEQIANEVRVLEREGHKRLLMLCGEHPSRSSLDYFVEAIETAYAVKTEKGGEIRRINVEIAPLTVPEFKRLKATKIGTYVLFQETYHHETYRRMHPSGPKADFAWRVTAMHRAQEGGINDVGIGALFGLYDYRYEVLGLLFHALQLEKDCGVGPHTISIPRLQPALNAPAADLPAAPGQRPRLQEAGRDPPPRRALHGHDPDDPRDAGAAQRRLQPRGLPDQRRFPDRPRRVRERFERTLPGGPVQPRRHPDAWTR